MKKLSIPLFAILVSFLVVTGESNAATIFGNHTTDAGKTVNLGGLEWLSFDESGYNHKRSSYNRYEIEAGIGGWINSTPESWRYATRVETENLLDSLWGGTNEGWHISNFDGVDWFLENISGFTTIDGINQAYFHFGYANNPYSSYFGAHTSTSTHGWFSDSYGLSTGIDPLTNHQFTTSKYDRFNHLLVREYQAPQTDPSTVPAPQAIWLMGTALIGLAVRRLTAK